MMDADAGYTVDELAQAIEAVVSWFPSVADITIPHIPITSGELASFLLFAPNAVIREMADEARRTGVAPFGGQDVKTQEGIA